MDESVIPAGGYCYRVVRIREGEVLSDDVARFGKELREFRYHAGYKEVLCPYWRRTDYGTVRCEYLGLEVLDNEDDEAAGRVAHHFGDPGAAERFGHSWALSDELKICGVNEWDDDDDEGWGT